MKRFWNIHYWNMMYQTLKVEPNISSLKIRPASIQQKATGKSRSMGPIMQLTSNPVHIPKGKMLWNRCVDIKELTYGRETSSSSQRKITSLFSLTWHFWEVGWVKPGLWSVFLGPHLHFHLIEHFYLAVHSPAVRPTPDWTRPFPSACERAAGSVWRWWSPSASAGLPSPSPETPSGLPGDPEIIQCLQCHSLVTD